MTRHLRRSSVLSCVVLMFLIVGTAKAQNAPEDSLQDRPFLRYGDSWYVKGRFGLNFYGGDRDINPNNEIQKYIENIGLSLGAEIGYHFSDRFSLGLKHISGRYPRIEDDADENGEPFERPAYGVIDQDATSKWRHHFSVVGRSYFFPQARISPYGQIGLNLSLGTINDEMRIGAGPDVALGFDVAIDDPLLFNRPWGIFLEGGGIFVFSDEALDLADTRAQNLEAEGSTDASDFDAFDYLVIGLRVNLSPPPVPPVVDCAGPEQLIMNETGTFAATINERATQPVTYTWSFDDGATGTGSLVTHAFGSAGTFAVSVTATNQHGTSTAVCPVVVIEPPNCTIQAVPASLDTCEPPLPPIQFRSTVSGTPPITYQWDFGDGTTSTEAEPSHTYTPGVEPTTQTFTATLRVSNEAGAATCTTPVTIEPCPCRDLAELGQACYDRNASVLSAESNEQSLQNLRDNLEILLDNPSIQILIEGYASPNERNAQQLADDRARSVRDFYVNGGIDPSRIQIRGVVQEQASKSGPVCTLTIPLPCDDAERARFLEERLGGTQQEENGQ